MIRPPRTEATNFSDYKDFLSDICTEYGKTGRGPVAPLIRPAWNMHHTSGSGCTGSNDRCRVRPLRSRTSLTTSLLPVQPSPAASPCSGTHSARACSRTWWAKIQTPTPNLKTPTLVPLATPTLTLLPLSPFECSNSASGASNECSCRKKLRQELRRLVSHDHSTTEVLDIGMSFDGWAQKVCFGHLLAHVPRTPKAGESSTVAHTRTLTTMIPGGYAAPETESDRVVKRFAKRCGKVLHGFGVYPGGRHCVSGASFVERRSLTETDDEERLARWSPPGRWEKGI
jgi:hypothetical protein